MKCLCCGKELRTEEETKTGWHKRCLNSFFGTERIPDISLDKKALDDLASKSVNKGLTIPGVQKKLSLHLEKDRRSARFTLVNYPTGYILKPQASEYNCLPEAEHLVMSMARATGISVVPFAMIKIDDEFAYITKRVDRLKEQKYAMEDFCQLSRRSTADKYKGSYEECGRILKMYSIRSGLDLSELFLRLVFCDVIGNSDMHLKNFSLLETEIGSRNYILSPAYDLLPVNVVMPADKEFMALTLNGKKRNLRKKDFFALADNIGLSEKVARNIINVILKKQDIYEKLIRDSWVTEEYKERLLVLMEQRMNMLK